GVQPPKTKQEDYHIQKFVEKGIKIRPPKPGKKVYNKMVQARLAAMDKKLMNSKLNKIREELEELKIARLHQHQIIYKSAEMKDPIKVGKLVDVEGKFAKYWLLSARETNGNNWGVSPISIAQNIQKFVGRPFVVTSSDWIEGSEYGDTFVHPVLQTNDLGRIFKYQAKYAAGIIRKIINEGDDYYAMIEMSPMHSHRTLPPFCSPAIFQLDQFEDDRYLTKWEPLHLAGLWEKPAYGARLAILRGTCIGTNDQCTLQFGAKMAQLNAAVGIDSLDHVTDRANKLHKYYKDKPYPNRLDEETAVMSYEQSGRKIYPPKNNLKSKYRKKIISAKLAAIKGLDRESDYFDPNNKRDIRYKTFFKNPYYSDTKTTMNVEEQEATTKYLEKGEKINPTKSSTGKKIRPSLKRKLAALKIAADDITVFRDDIKHGEEFKAHIDTIEGRARVKLLKKNGLGGAITVFRNDIKHGDSYKAHVDSVEGRTRVKLQKTAGLKKKDKLSTLIASSQSSVIDSFKNKKPEKSGNYESTGNALYLFKHKIAEHSEKGLKVSNAGYATPTTHMTLKRVGVDFKVQGGATLVNGKPYKNGTFVTIPYEQLKEKKYNTVNRVPRGEGIAENKSVGILRNLQKKVKEKYGYESQTTIQPRHQREINSITGIKSKIPKRARADVAHHIFFKGKVPGLQFNPNNLIPMDNPSHRELHRLNARLAALRSETNSAVKRVNILGSKTKKRRYKMAQIHPGAQEVINSMKKTNTLVSTFLAPNGDLLEHGDINHYAAVRQNAHKVGMKLKIGDTDRLPQVDDSDIHEFLKRTGLIRVQSFARAQQISLHIPQRMTSAQLKTVDDIAKSDPNLEIGYAIGADFNNMSFGKGIIRELLREHAKQFGQKEAQAEGENNVFNMTYNKPSKVKRKRPYGVPNREKKYRRYYKGDI
ncbi:MAG: hypothetical protein ACRD9Q_05375, partial [Nitrososphaeraceae archaeon]